MAFAETLAAQEAGRTVRLVPLVWFDFKSAPKRLWPGFGPLGAGGHVWEGIGRPGSLSAMAAGEDGAVEEMTFTLAATEAMLADIEDDADETIGRTVHVYLQNFEVKRFDAAGDFAEWRTLDDPYSIFWGRMGPVKIERGTNQAGGGTAQRSIKVTGQSIFVTRGRPPFAFFSDRDQKSRSSDGLDNLCVKVSTFSEGSVKWPSFNSA